MRVTRDAYLRAVDVMRREGEVTESTFVAHDAEPFLLATLSVRVAHDDVASSAARLARLAVSTGAYLTMHVHDSEAVIRVQVSVDLPTQEAA